jgi:phosphoribosylamine--glycine ligase
MATDVLIIGGGGREHSLVWKLKQSPRVGKICVAPGNGGTDLMVENVPIDVMDFENLAKFAKEKNIGFTIVAPDDPLAGGAVDFLQSKGLRVWGPMKAAAQIEGSKAFAKEFMARAKIPTAEFKIFTSASQALAYLHSHGAPVVVKASGLALGKGVYVCHTTEEAETAIDEIMVKRVHKDSGNEVVIEDFLEGHEISVHALTGGIDYILFPSSQDHKRALDNDQGKNTGGMGVIAPVPWVSEEMMSEIEAQVVAPAFQEFKKRGIEYKGILYPGIMMTASGPKVLEFNARFGDPECQVYMRLLRSDLLDLLEASVDSNIFAIKHAVEWDQGFAVNIVLASGGYPDEYKKGLPITGIEEAEKISGVVVFHAGTKMDNGQLVTTGGRVLGVSAVGGTLKEALDSAYKAIDKIHFEGMQYRHDIGAKSLAL